MVRAGRELRPRTDYILGTDRRLFRNVTVRDPHRNSDQYLVLGCLRGAPLREHSEYLGRRKRSPPSAPPDHPYEGGQNLCGLTEGRTEASGQGYQEKHMDIGGHVETH